MRSGHSYKKNMSRPHKARYWNIKAEPATQAVPTLASIYNLQEHRKSVGGICIPFNCHDQLEQIIPSQAHLTPSQKKAKETISHPTLKTKPTTHFVVRETIPHTVEREKDKCSSHVSSKTPPDPQIVHEGQQDRVSVSQWLDLMLSLRGVVYNDEIVDCWKRRILKKRSPEDAGKE